MIVDVANQSTRCPNNVHSNKDNEINVNRSKFSSKFGGNLENHVTSMIHLNFWASYWISNDVHLTVSEKEKYHVRPIYQKFRKKEKFYNLYIQDIDFYIARILHNIINWKFQIIFYISRDPCDSYLIRI